ncbi:polysaccharide deacetylase family protein [Bacillus sp. V33-4]|uniref:polysaccharide deacetylase family protein n=1 Tax=Bacillus sp. V33-4 TaxID=2054169 RepID=UPI000C775DF1|nr:polysaccharide deacetylase family protein [Bacillus sp. V33-4]PLR84711.1 polysaccharide deacetylase family protein [Bacillus sp. V33-4]
MSVYQGKLLELSSIERAFNKSFLHIKLTFEQEVELLWEIDDDTAEKLKAITAFEQNYKYRLSLQSFWDPSRQQHTSFLTKTYCDHSDRLQFACSEEYVKALNSIKQIQQTSEVQTLPFLAINTPFNDFNQDQPGVTSRRYNRKLGWMAVAMISVMSTILLGYSGHSFINETTIAQKTTVKAESVVEDAVVNQAEPEPLIPEEEIDVANQTAVPVIDLNEAVTYSIPEGSVALTFDDGPSKYSVEIVNILNNYQVGGTFFFMGMNVKKYPESVQYAKSNGYAIGSHSMNHPNFANLSLEMQESELLQSNQLLAEVIGEKVELFRPPYGAKNAATIDLMAKHQQKMVLWNKDTEDWKGRSSEEIFHYVLSSQASGSIILLHESQSVIEALPQIIEYLQGQGLQIVSLN